MTDPQPEAPKPRSKRIYVLWGVALALLLALGLFCWLVVAPYLRTHAVVQDYTDSFFEQAGVEESQLAPFVKRLGGQEEAAENLSFYLQLPNWATDNRPAAVWLLASCGKSGVEPLMRALMDEDPSVRAFAAGALGKIGPDADVSVPALARCLGDAEARVRAYAASSLSRIGPGAEAALPALTASLEDPDNTVRFYSITTLGAMGPKAREAVPALEKVAKNDRWPSTRQAAAEALKKIKAAQGKDK